jgi:wyosine [tRNA(Phe)-imidazoG37] synthetase (radical SAM superfamily)
MPLPALEHIMYGPVRSRRLGTSLGINLLPAGKKICNMNCAYCQYGWTRGAVRYRGQGPGWPTAQAVDTALSARLSAGGRAQRGDRSADSGRPRRTDAAPGIRGDRPATPLGARSHRAWDPPGHPVEFDDRIRRRRQARLGAFDERYMKLDAGDSATFATLNGGGRHLSDVLDALRTLSPIVVQAMFVRDARGVVGNSGDAAIRAWLEALETIRATRVHIYTIDRSPALGSLSPVPPRRLREIAEQVRALGIHTDVFQPRRCDPERASATSH